MAFYDSNEIREAAYLCSFQVEEIEPMQIIADILNTEEDLRYFCKINDIDSPNTFMYVNYPSPIVSVLSQYYWALVSDQYVDRNGYLSF